MKSVNHREVLECASPLALSFGVKRFKSARGLAHSKTLSRFSTFIFAFLIALRRTSAATNAAEEIGIPKLVPPYAELPRTFWEQHGSTVIIAVILGLVIIGVLVWFLTRKKSIAALPPEIQARRALEALRQKAEDGVVLSRISRILRQYFVARFELPRDELTTTEFCRALSDNANVGSELAVKVSDFLQRCDERKFSAARADSLNAAAVALELVALGEARRAQLQQSTSPASP